VSIREARVGDRYLVCSDGLSGVVSEQTLAETLGKGDPDSAAESLIGLALRGGGPDNITAIVADVVETGDDPPSAVPIAVGAVAESPPVRDEASTPAAKAALLARDAEDGDDLEDVAGDSQPRRRGLRGTLLAVLVLLVLVGLGIGGWQWSQHQYYVGASGEQVAIFRGLSQDIGGISTGHVYEKQDIALTDLPEYTRDQVKGSIDATDLVDARRIVGRLHDEAEACQRARAAGSATPTPTVTPSPTARVTASPRPAVTARPTGTPSPTATSTATASPSPTSSLSAADCGAGS
jgi:protein phosphatase